MGRGLLYILVIVVFLLPAVIYLIELMSLRQYALPEYRIRKFKSQKVEKSCMCNVYVLYFIGCRERVFEYGYYQCFPSGEERGDEERSRQIVGIGGEVVINGEHRKAL